LKKNLLLFFCVGAMRLVFCQQNYIMLKAKAVDSLRNGIPYVNIGIAEKDIGTVSDSIGNFMLKIPQNLGNESLLFTSVGFEDRSIPVQQLLSAHEIFLTAKFQQLQQVVVLPKQLSIKVLGNTTQSMFLSAGFSSGNLGAQAGTRIRIRHAPAYLEKVNFHLSYNKLDSIKVRLNIYEMKDGIPGNNILPENVIISIPDKKAGNFEIDLSKYNLTVKDDILIALELIQAKGDATSGVYMSASLFGNPTYYKETSQSEWKKLGKVSIGINVTVKY